MEITEAQYRRIEHCFPRQRDNVRLADLRVLNAILYVAEEGCHWRGLPRRFGNWHTIYTRMSRWYRRGVLDRVFVQLQHDRIVRIRRSDGRFGTDSRKAIDRRCVGRVAKVHLVTPHARTPVMPMHPIGGRLVAVACAMLYGAWAHAQPAESVDELAAQATDPTASLMSLQVNDWYTASYHDLDGSANQVVFRAAIPFAWGETSHIFRITQPYVTSSPSGTTGFTDTTIFDLMVFNQPWGRWGVGISGTLPTGQDGLTTDKWTAGPALGFVNSSSKQHNWGLFAQTFFSFAGKGSTPGVGLINLQPIYSYQLGGGRSLSLGNSSLIYDTRGSRWASLLLGVNYGQVVSFAGQKWRPNVEVNYDFKDDVGNQQWVVRAGIVLLLPK